VTDRGFERAFADGHGRSPEVSGATLIESGG